MNGAQALIASLVGAGVDVCFMYPGTSEMHFVAALDSVPRMRGVLALFEGVATGAADGYARIAGRPAAVLLHLGPGLANGLANLHNARRAGSPVVVIVGAHATGHVRYDAPLQSDIEALARTVSGWVHTCGTTRDLAQDAMRAVAAARRGQIATLVLPADVSWGDGAVTAPARAVPPPAVVDDSQVASAASVLSTRAMLFLGGRALSERGLRAASRISAATGARLLAETFPARHERGAGIPAVDRLAYLVEFAAGQLAGVRHLILAGASAPVSFFAYPDKPGTPVPADCRVHALAEPGDDVPGALAALADLVAVGAAATLHQPVRPGMPDGELTGESAAAVIGALLPDGAIVCDEANTSGLWLPGATAGAPPHDWLSLTGGAIGQGLPLAAGAAIACPDRPVLALEADGSAMYTVSALWTYAREQLDVTTVIFSNRSYAVLKMELARTGAAAGPAARDLLDLSRPDLDFTALAAGLGVPASRAATAAEFAVQLKNALAEPGPHLIEAVLPAIR